MTETIKKRSRAPRGQGDKLRAQILDATTQLLVETGNEEAVSIRAVADRVGVTPPSIYMHFADKNELIFAVCEEHFGELDARIEEAAKDATDPLDSLRRRGRAYIQFGLDHPEQYRVLFMSKAAAAPEGFQEERLKRTAAFDHLVDAVREVIDQGLIEGDPVQVAVCLWSAGHGITSLLIAHPDFDWPDIEQTIDLVLYAQMFGLVRRPG